jgi:broad specificity phosphatase PhoE
MTTVYLVRHAVHSAVDHVLVGRNQQVGLSSEGFWQAGCLAEYFSRMRIRVVQTSPQLRARQTARAIAGVTHRAFPIVPHIDEIDAGDWTGRRFDELANDPRWQRWNSDRASARMPNGESMQEVQERICRHLAHVAAAYPDQRILMVTHAEVIRAAILRFRGMALQDFVRVPIDPASVTTISLRRNGGEVIRENQLPNISVAA